MKKTLLLPFLLFSFIASGQIWLDIGAKGGYGLGFILNQNLLDDRPHEFKLGNVLSYGGKVGLNFGDNHGIALDVLFSNLSQSYDYNTSLVDIRNNEIARENLDLYVMYRLQSDGVYFEVGPKFSTLRSTTHIFGPVDIAGEDNYSEKNTGAALGWGGYLLGNEFFSLMFGMRVDYMFTDLVSEKGQAAGYPAPYRIFETYKPTNAVTGQIMLELNFGLGGYAKTRCGKRAFVFGRR